MFEDPIELNLFKIKEQYWALNDKDGDNQLNQESGLNYIGIKYPVEFIGNIKIPRKYFDK